MAGGAGVVAAEHEAREQRVGHFGGVADGSKKSSLSVSGGAAEPQAGKVKTTTSLCPLLVVGGQARKGRESFPDSLVEVFQRFLLQVRGDGAHAVCEFAHAGTVSKS